MTLLLHLVPTKKKGEKIIIIISFVIYLHKIVLQHHPHAWWDQDFGRTLASLRVLKSQLSCHGIIYIYLDLTAFLSIFLEYKKIGCLSCKMPFSRYQKEWKILWGDLTWTGSSFRVGWSRLDNFHIGPWITPRPNCKKTHPIIMISPKTSVTEMIRNLIIPVSYTHLTLPTIYSV